MRTIPTHKVHADIAAPPASAASASGNAIEQLARQLARDADLQRRLSHSLDTARTRAADGIKPALFDALDWPLTPAAYLDYLGAFARLIPQQTPAEPWRDPNNDGYQELHDRMTHFYWLIDQPLDGDGTVLQADAWFAEWLVRYVRAWGSFLDTEDSLTADTLASFAEHSPAYALAESQTFDGVSVSPSGFRTFNQFFARALAPGARPITEPYSNAVLTAVADAGFESQHAIADDGSFPDITIKHAHAYATVSQLLGADDELAAAFAGGHYVHYHLKPYAYHRFHTPAAGRVIATRHLEGRVYLKTGIESGKLEGFNDASNGYEFVQQRGVLILDTSAAPGQNDIGRVALVPVGMGHVSSVRITAAPGGLLRKGDEFGLFMYGGSDVVVLFEARAHVELDEFAEDRMVGQTIGSALPAS